MLPKHLRTSTPHPLVHLNWWNKCLCGLSMLASWSSHIDKTNTTPFFMAALTDFIPPFCKKLVPSWVVFTQSEQKSSVIESYVLPCKVTRGFLIVFPFCDHNLLTSTISPLSEPSEVTN